MMPPVGVSTPPAPEPAGATSPGLDAVVEDHEQFRMLFQRYRTATSPTVKQETVATIVREVSRHASAEERTLYPLLLHKLGAEGKMLFDRNVLDDQMNKEVLYYLDTHTPQNDLDWQIYDKTLIKFATMEEEHLSMEEEQVVDRLRKLLTPEEKEHFTRDWHAAKANAPLKPHPGAPSQGLGAKLTHPVAGVIDKSVEAAHAVYGRSVEAAHAAYDQAMHAATPVMDRAREMATPVYNSAVNAATPIIDKAREAAAHVMHPAPAH